MSSLSIPTDQVPETLRAAIVGDVFVPGDERYDAARTPWNLASDLRPAIVVIPADSADVLSAVEFARANGMRIAPQSTGHGSVPLESLEGAMLIRTSRMRGVGVYPATRIARAEAGAEWQDVTVPAHGHGLAALAGTSANVGVAGYTLGGGMGWLARQYGLAANSVTAVEIVLPTGLFARVDADHEPDLFWALRGGGGQVGVVTALEMKLYPIASLYAGALLFPIERSSEVLHAWRAWTEALPNELTSIARVLRVPDVPDVPNDMRGRSFALIEAAYAGDPDAGAKLLDPLRGLQPQLDTFDSIPAPALQRLHMDPDAPVPGVGDGALLADLPDEAIDALVDIVGPGSQTPLMSVEIRHLGGALARENPTGGAQPKIDARYVAFALGIAPTPERRDVVAASVQALKDALAPWRAGYDYYNFAETRAEADAVLPPSSYDRMREIKAVYDPDETIISAHPVALR